MQSWGQVTAFQQDRREGLAVMLLCHNFSGSSWTKWIQMWVKTATRRERRANLSADWSWLQPLRLKPFTMIHFTASCVCSTLFLDLKMLLREQRQMERTASVWVTDQGCAGRTTESRGFAVGRLVFLCCCYRLNELLASCFLHVHKFSDWCRRDKDFSLLFPSLTSWKQWVSLHHMDPFNGTKTPGV